MKKENQFLQEISSLIKIFDKAFLLLSTDKFLYNEAEMEKLYESKKISEELDEIKLDVFFMQLANEGFKEVIFNDLLIKIGKYDDLVFEKKIITNNKFLNAYFERIPQLFKIQQRIKIKEKDICDVKQYNSVMPEFEKQKIISEFEKSIGTSKDAVQLKKSFENDPKLYSLFSHSKREIVLFVLKNNCNEFVTNWIEKINNHIIDLNLMANCKMKSSTEAK